ncbi:histidine protein methyltransferase 1 homolog [Drosophila novamexicana]|uniref:histidine protein methyltransferase 1 homolog n=1 Tax=Drosophila novamexicana TaxID=47314 RepID=UPI0011E5F548|nr:histidine protein methyltransferase 1 homolog [Drosophila novamexicana]
MFKFNFEVNDSDSSDNAESPFKKPKVEQKINSDSEKEEIILWYQAEQIKPTKAILQSLDLYELNAKELTFEDVELRHIIAGFLLEDIKRNSDVDSQDIKKSEESHSDLIAGVYEGGAKIWECTDDLLKYLFKNYEKKHWENKLVLDLGCGSGLLGIYAMKCGAKVDFQDYNKDVLEKITIPNVLLNLNETLTDNEKIDQLQKKSNFYAGDWSHYAKLTENLEKYDIIMTSETIYNMENQQKLLDTFRKRLKSDGIVLLAAKSHYFGVGGGLEQFVEFVKSGKDFQSTYLWQADENLKRGIIELKLH